MESVDLLDEESYILTEEENELFELVKIHDLDDMFFLLKGIYLKNSLNRFN